MDEWTGYTMDGVDAGGWDGLLYQASIWHRCLRTSIPWGGACMDGAKKEGVILFLPGIPSTSLVAGIVEGETNGLFASFVSQGRR